MAKFLRIFSSFSYEIFGSNNIFLFGRENASLKIKDMIQSYQVLISFHFYLVLQCFSFNFNPGIVTFKPQINKVIGHICTCIS